jgi:two-component system, chemotaxis family, chemotaxis protein CheY
VKYKVLIVDDSPLLRATARRAVLQAGIGADLVREAANGKEALDALNKDRADLVLLDINMPVMDGFQFVEEKAKVAAFAGIKVALVTTEGNKKRLERMTQLGITHYLRKPFEPEELRSLVAQLFGPGK